MAKLLIIKITFIFFSTLSVTDKTFTTRKHHYKIWYSIYPCQLGDIGYYVKILQGFNKYVYNWENNPQKDSTAKNVKKLNFNGKMTGNLFVSL